MVNDNRQEIQPLIVELTTMTGEFDSADHEDLLSSADDLILTYQTAIQPYRETGDSKTIWVSLLKYSEKFATYIGELIELKKNEFESFRKNEKYQSIINLNHIIENMIINMIRNYQPNEILGHDLFLSHAGEQKEKTIKPLRDALSEEMKCFFDDDSLVAGDSISEEICHALLTCHVGLALISKQFVKKRWPLLELFILSARLRDDDDFKLVVATSCSTTEEQMFYSKGWDGWFDCVHRLPLPWPSDGMPVAMKLIDDGCSSSNVQPLCKAVTESVISMRAKRWLKEIRQRIMWPLSVLLLSLLIFFLWPKSQDPTKSMNLMVGPFHVPKSVPYFQGREKELDQLTEMVTDQNSVIVVPHGPGGIGKTQLVNAWVHDNEEEYGAIIWLRAENNRTLIDDLVSYSYITGLSTPLDPENDTEIATRVIRVIEAHGEAEQPILLVYDNAESYSAVEPWLPAFGSVCDTIITTRVSTGLDEDSLLTLGPLDREASIRVVEYFVNHAINDEEERNEILDIFKECDYLPLAIVAFATQARDLGISRAIRRFRDHQEQALEETLQLGPNFSGIHRGSVSIVLRMQLESLSPDSMAAFEDMSILNAERIPLLLLEALMQDIDFYAALKDMEAKSVIQFDVGDESISTHRLLQDSAWEAMSNNRRKEVFHSVDNAMKSVTPARGSAERNEVLNNLLSHSNAIMVRYWPDESKAMKGNIYNNLAIRFYRKGEYDKALDYFRKALSARKISLGDDHPEVAKTLINMSQVYMDQGMYEKALGCYEQALSIEKKSLGENNPRVAAVMKKMALVYEEQGLYDEALDWFTQALSVQKASMGNDHPGVATIMKNIAHVYNKDRLYDDALGWYKQALSIQMAALGDNSTSVASTLNSIGIVYYEKRSYKEALDYLEQALSIRKALLGDDHPDVASTMWSIASVYLKQGLYQEALEMQEHALAIKNASLSDPE